MVSKLMNILVGWLIAAVFFGLSVVGCNYIEACIAEPPQWPLWKFIFGLYFPAILTAICVFSTFVFSIGYTIFVLADDDE